MPGPTITPSSPWVDGKQVSYGTLAATLGVSKQAVQKKYKRLMEIHATDAEPKPVTTTMMRAPIVDPARQQARLAQAREEYRLRVAQFVWRHGPTRCEILMGVPKEEAKQIAEEVAAAYKK